MANVLSKMNTYKQKNLTRISLMLERIIKDESKQAKEFNASSKMLWKREMEPNRSS